MIWGNFNYWHNLKKIEVTHQLGIYGFFSNFPDNIWFIELSPKIKLLRRYKIAFFIYFQERFAYVHFENFKMVEQKVKSIFSTTESKWQQFSTISSSNNNKSNNEYSVSKLLLCYKYHSSQSSAFFTSGYKINCMIWGSGKIWNLCF